MTAEVSRGSYVFNGNGQEVSLDVQGTSSATVSIVGDFIGKISFIGKTSVSAADGDRQLMQTGVGPTGLNYIVGDGEISREYRIVTGSERIIIRSSEWASGSVAVELYATQDPSIAFINGPVQTPFENAIRGGRAFIAAAEALQITVDYALYMILENPSGNTRNMVIENRNFGVTYTSSPDPLKYRAYGNPTATLANTTNPINLKLSESNGSNCLLHWEVAAVGTITMGGDAGSSEPLPVNGTPVRRPLEIVVPPGTTLGFVVQGAGGNNSAVDAFASFEWFEEDINN